MRLFNEFGANVEPAVQENIVLNCINRNSNDGNISWRRGLVTAVVEGPSLLLDVLA